MVDRIHSAAAPGTPASADVDASSPTLLEYLQPLRFHWRALIAAPLTVGVLAFGASYLITPVFVSSTTFVPPQPQQGIGGAALAQLSMLTGGNGGRSNPADLYVTMMQSVTVSDRLIDRFHLMAVYERRFRFETRQQLAKNVRMNIGKKDGLVTVDVEDTNPQRAADIANAYVEELRKVTSTLAVTEAQQRRIYFENQVKETRVRLDAAQAALQQSGFNTGSLRAEPRAAADNFARLQAQVTAAEVRLQTLRGGRAEGSPEVEQQVSTLSALRQQLALLERTDTDSTKEPGAQYMSRYRDFKYQETLLELYAHQYELARVDESRDSGLIQVLDPARPAEQRARPQRVVMAASYSLFGLLAAALWFIVRGRNRKTPDRVTP